VALTARQKDKLIDHLFTLVGRLLRFFFGIALLATTAYLTARILESPEIAELLVNKLVPFSPVTILFGVLAFVAGGATLIQRHAGRKYQESTGHHVDLLERQVKSLIKLVEGYQRIGDSSTPEGQDNASDS
jgi:hypothetical protein